MDELAKGLTDQPCPSQTTENALTRPESDYLGDKSATRNVIEPTNVLFHKIIGSNKSNTWRAHHLTLFHIFIILYIRPVVHHPRSSKTPTSKTTRKKRSSYHQTCSIPNELQHIKGHHPIWRGKENKEKYMLSFRSYRRHRPTSQ